MFEILEHAADVGFRVRACSLPELFAHAAAALVGMAMETAAIEPREVHSIEASGDSRESLLVNWLSEVLYLVDGKQLALRDFGVAELTGDHVRGEASGERRDSSRHAPKLVIKGVTYHQLKIEETADGWCAEVFLDV
jgi:SHS2 domain-containing protein